MPRTVLGKRKLPVFWCLSCFEWGTTFYDISNGTPKPLNDRGLIITRVKLKSGEEDVEHTAMKLSQLPSNKKAGARSKLGGSPRWVQQEAIPECPRCDRSMSFLLQLASDSDIAFADMGLLYAFVCEKCKVLGSLIQSH